MGEVPVLTGETLQLVALALREDLGPGDVTSEALIPAEAVGTAFFLAKEEIIVCGNWIAEAVFRELDQNISFKIIIADGSQAKKGDAIAEVSGSLRTILSGERTALNFMQRLSGIATKVSQLVQLAAGKCQLLDTRKTTPGMRELEKYAVRTGGAMNHRSGLFDMVLIKNNHIDATGGDAALAVKKARDWAPNGMKVEVEVRDNVELESALLSKPDIILLDNMSPRAVAESVKRIRASDPLIQIEASGGIDEENLPEYADTGVDFLSLGMLTHTVKSADISLRIK